ncbi:hypothetical protein [Leucobacter salsicius]|uniref:hypothetical protein n=1 Tax=Leucobacter salsicius TaxID=664638 RepID=UPI00034ABEE5|nr:hypothetical protein [Leucobacter salsicius]
MDSLSNLDLIELLHLAETSTSADTLDHLIEHTRFVTIQETALANRHISRDTVERLSEDYFHPLYYSARERLKKMRRST